MKYIIVTMITFMLSFQVSSKEVVIDMLNKREDGQRMVYSQDVVKIEVGDSVTWVPKDPGHNVEFLAGPEGYESPPRSFMNRKVTMTFEKPGIYLYVCTPHAMMGMVGLVVVGNDVSNKEAIANYDDKTTLGGKGLRKAKKLVGDL